MKRYAAHYIFLSPAKIFKLHYIELDDANWIRGVYPLENEIGKTQFHNGILFPVSMDLNLSAEMIWGRLLALHEINPDDSVFKLLEKLSIAETTPQTPVAIWQLDGIDLLSSKFSANNGCSNGYIKRL